MSRFFVFSTGTGSTSGTDNRTHRGPNNQQQSNSTKNQSPDKGLDQVEEAEFEDITDKTEEKSQ